MLSSFGGWVCEARVGSQQQCVRDEFAQEPPYGVRDPRCRSVRDPHIKGPEMLDRRPQIDRLHAVVGLRATVFRGVPGKNLGPHWGDGVLLEVEGVPMKAFIRRLRGVVVERLHDVECQLNLEQTLVDVSMTAIGVKAGSCRDDMVLRGPDGTLRAIALLDIWSDKLEPQLRGFELIV